jgi:hypothetical protein
MSVNNAQRTRTSDYPAEPVVAEAHFSRSPCWEQLDGPRQACNPVAEVGLAHAWQDNLAEDDSGVAGCHPVPEEAHAVTSAAEP